MALINPITVGGGAILLLWLLSGGKKKAGGERDPAKPVVAPAEEDIDAKLYADMLKAGTWLPAEPSKFSQMPAKKPGFVVGNSDTFIVLARYGYPDAVVARVRVLEVHDDPALGGKVGTVVTVPLAKGAVGKVLPSSGSWDEVVTVDAGPEDFFQIEGDKRPLLGAKFVVPAVYEIEATSIKEMIPDDGTPGVEI